jgi:outer membrane protein OmpA-like peptidoglycan-associated protein
MRPDRKSRRDIGLLIAVLIGLAALPSAARAQATAAADDPVAKLSGLETTPDIDVAALRQTVTERVKSKADNIALKRPPVAAELLKLPRLAVDIHFDEDTAIIRPDSYRALGRIADTLLNPALLTYKFLIIGHSVSTGRRDINLALSQRRADSVRDVLITTFRIPPNRVQAIGLGEEQLLDSARPTAPVNQQVEVATIGALAVEPAASVPDSPSTSRKAGKASSTSKLKSQR